MRYEVVLAPEAIDDLKRMKARVRAAGVLIGFESEDDWFDYKLEHDPRFLQRIEAARRNIKAGCGIRIEDAG